MKLSELFIKAGEYHPRNRDIMTPDKSLPTKRITTAIDAMYSDDIPYLDIIRKIRSTFGSDAMHFAKKYIHAKIDN